MIHDFATTPRTDWRAEHKGVEFKSDKKETAKAPRSRSFLVITLAASLVLLISQWFFQGGEPALDQQPDDAAKKEYAESLLYGDESEALVEVADQNEALESTDLLMPEVVEKPKPLIKSVTTIQPVKSVQRAAKPAQVSASVEESVEIDPDYEFYDFLSKDSWPIPLNEGVYVDGELADREKPVYKLQAASFRSKDDAYRLVAKLKQRKLRALVYESVSTSGEFWYQVSVGPFVSTSKMNKAQDVLVSMSMMPLKKRVR